MKDEYEKEIEEHDQKQKEWRLKELNLLKIIKSLEQKLKEISEFCTKSQAECAKKDEECKNTINDLTYKLKSTSNTDLQNPDLTHQSTTHMSPSIYANVPDIISHDNTVVI